MVTKIFLIIAIVAGLAAAGIGYLKVQPRIVTAEEERAQFASERDTERSAKIQTQAELKKTQEERDSLSSQLADTQSALSSKTAEAAEFERSANDLRGQLSQANQQIDTLKTEYADFLELRMPVATIKKIRDELPRVRDERDTFAAENQIMAKKVADLRNEIIALKEEEVTLPKGLRGRVVAVDPRYEFVVLDIGSNHGVLVNGEMLVNRDGQLLGKIRIMSVESDHAIGNIMQDWKQGEVIEGDLVVH